MRYLIIILALLTLGYAATGVTQIERGERGVIRRFGRVLEVKAEPGLWIGLPWGMDRVDRIAVDRIQSLTVGFDPEAGPREEQVPEGQFLTGDQNLVNVQVVVYYRVRTDELNDYVLMQDRVDALLTRTVESCLSEWIAGQYVDDIRLDGKRFIPEMLLAEVKRRVVPYRLGVEVVSTRVTVVSMPEEVQRAFEDVTRAQANKETQRLRALQDRATREAGARADADRIIKAAAGYLHRQQALAEGQATAFRLRLDELRRASADNPHYLRQLWIEERSKLFRKLQETGQLGLLDEFLKDASSGDSIMSPNRTTP
jgi:membrane protease subunit HflK